MAEPSTTTSVGWYAASAADAVRALAVDPPAGLSLAEAARRLARHRGTELPEGTPDDPPGAQTVHGMGNPKNAPLLQRLLAGGVRVYEGSRSCLQAACDAGLRRAVVSASADTAQVLAVTGLGDLVKVRVYGATTCQRALVGKPSPDMFLHAAALRDVAPQRAAVFEDAVAGVAAGRAGEFGYVVGVDRIGRAAALREQGADVVVRELLEAPGDR